MVGFSKPPGFSVGAPTNFGGSFNFPGFGPQANPTAALMAPQQQPMAQQSMQPQAMPAAMPGIPQPAPSMAAGQAPGQMPGQMPGMSFGAPYWMQMLGMGAPQASPITPFVPPSQNPAMPQPSVSPFPGWQAQFGHPTPAPAPVAAAPTPAAPSQAAVQQMIQQALADQNNPDLNPGRFGQFGR